MRCSIIIIIIICSLASLQATCQVKENPPDNTVEQQLEEITENNDDAETEDDSYLQELAQYRKDPLNLNIATADQLLALRFLNALQIENLISYRNLLGPFVNIFELQAIPPGM